MKLTPPLKQAKLIKRYKRFLADIKLEDGSELTIHCPNTGSMLNCNMPGSNVWYSTVNNTKRKYPHTWEIIENVQKHLIGINTHRANALVAEALEQQVISELKNYSEVKKEVKYGEQNSRIDFLLSHENQKCYMEVKNVTLAEGEIAYFPDAVTARGTKHLQELTTMLKQGQNAVLLFCVQHTGVNEVRVAEHIDPQYAKTLKVALKAGLEVLCYKADISADEIVLKSSIPFNL